MSGVANLASFGSTIAPGQMVAISGAGLGPKKLAYLHRDENGLVNTHVEGVRVLFDGVPAPVIYVSDQECAAVVPYFGAVSPTTHVQVEYLGVRSDPLEIQITATGPGLFSADATGHGQGAITNQDHTRNSASNPAAIGSLVTLWATGEGITDPPGVDGRLAVEVLARPVAAVSVDIGGVAATVQYAGASDHAIAGVLQVDVRIPAGVAPGAAVPAHLKIGNQQSQDGVTLAIH